MPRNWNPEDLCIIVPAVYSVDACLKELQIPLSGGNRETVKRWIKNLNLDTSHFTGQGHRKGSDTPVFEKIPLHQILIKNSTYTNSHRLKLRLISENYKQASCECCKLSNWLDSKIPLELHHKNGDRQDHTIDNLELLCPNCHALTDNYRAKNIQST